MENKTIEIPIKISSSALKELKSLQKMEDESKSLRLGVKNGGCAGFSYILEFEEATDSDEHYEMDGLSIVIDKMHLLHINNLELDYENGLNNRGFTFTNPNARTTCGCGTSFS
ncbi:MAG: HesB/IscA family protein [Chitinophagales bacterium]